MTQLVPAASTGPVSTATVLTRHRGQLLLTAIAKATFRFAHQGEMKVLPPLDIVESDVHIAKNPMRSVRVSSDLRPRLAHPEVTFVGRAHAPAGQPVERMSVRLGLASDAEPVLGKRLEVIGDRALAQGGAASAPQPFAEMLIGYERALGGLGWPDNPLGVGATADSQGLPNILYADPAQQKRVAGFGPLAATWPVRKRLLGRGPLPAAGPVMELAEDFDWRFFQAAPPDQQLASIPPRCWIVLEGLNPRHPSLQMRLPSCRVLARLEGRGGQMGVELVADTLFIDGEAEHCTVTWRGNFEIARLEALEDAWVGVVLQKPNEPLVWPARPARRPAAAIAPAPALAGTVAIQEPKPVKRTSSVANLRAVMSGRGAGGSSLPPPTTALPNASASAAPPPLTTAPPNAGASAAGDLAGTMLIAEPPATAPLPFSPAAGGGGGGHLAGTMLIQAPVEAVSLPFAGGEHAVARKPSDPPAPLPGAPWADGAAPVAVIEARPDLSGTLAIPVPSPAPKSAPPPPAVVVAPAPPPPEPPPPPPEPPPPEPPPPPPEPPPPPPEPPPPPPEPPPPPPEPPPPPPEPEVKAPKHRDDPGVWAPQVEAAPLAPPKPRPALPPKQNLSAGLYKNWKKS